VRRLPVPPSVLDTLSLLEPLLLVAVPVLVLPPLSTRP
jgi:hypothetical protein